MKNYLNFINENKNLIYDPTYYLDDFYSMDFNDEKSEKEALEIIKKVINHVNNFKFPMIVYRGISIKDSDKIQKENDDFLNYSWTPQKHIAESFGNIIFIGIIPNKDVILVEDTIRNRVMNPAEDEICISFNNVEIIKTYKLNKY